MSCWSGSPTDGFLSTLPARGATVQDPCPFAGGKYFYPRSPRGERHAGQGHQLVHLDISIHAPREGSDDQYHPGDAGRDTHFYPRSPRGERRPKTLTAGTRGRNFYPRSPRGERPDNIWERIRWCRFLSTLPARGATGLAGGWASTGGHFYPRSPRGERPGYGVRDMVRPPDFYPRSPRGERREVLDYQALCQAISIHAPREGSDLGVRVQSGVSLQNFYPRSPRGERLVPPLFERQVVVISIHAPREGSDQMNAGRDWRRNLISIHAPREGSDAWRCLCNDRLHAISIHAPREGSDSKSCRQTCPTLYFYPRSPRGERPAQERLEAQRARISIHAPREGSDQQPLSG